MPSGWALTAMFSAFALAACVATSLPGRPERIATFLAALPFCGWVLIASAAPADAAEFVTVGVLLGVVYAFGSWANLIVDAAPGYHAA